MNSVSSPIRAGWPASAAVSRAGSSIQRDAWGTVRDMGGPPAGAGTIPLAIIRVMQSRTLVLAALGMLSLLGACADEGSDGTRAPAAGSHGPRVVVGEDQPVPNWRPPEVAVPAGDID